MMHFLIYLEASFAFATRRNLLLGRMSNTADKASVAEIRTAISTSESNRLSGLHGIDTFQLKEKENLLGGGKLKFQPKVVIKLVKDAHTGGPEAMCQLYLAFEDAGADVYNVDAGTMDPTPLSYEKENGLLNSSDPSVLYTRTNLPSDYRKLYPTVGLKPIELSKLSAGDIYIVPEMCACEKEVAAVPAGVRVFIWLLGNGNLGPDRCGRIGHDHFLSVKANASATLTPYISEDVKQHARAAGVDTHGDLEKRLLKSKENLVLIDEDAKYASHSRLQGCSNASDLLRALNQSGIKATEVNGFTRPQSLDLFSKAKVVFDSCMRGSERMPLEASLHGALLITDYCDNGSDEVDFPLPPYARLSQKSSCDEIFSAISTALAEYPKRFPQERYRFLRNRYLSEIGRQSMSREAKGFLKLVG